MGDCFLWLVSLLHQRFDSMTENKKTDVIEQQSYLSDDLIIHEILTRLPVKSILRFKSVSKLWYTALFSSKFASFHLTKFPFFHPSAPVNTLFIESCKDYYLYSYDDDDQISGNFKDKLVKLDVDFGVENYLKFIGCCNGLICLSDISGEYFFLWNPATRKHHKYASDGYLKGKYFASTATGFGYASLGDDYKYVRILTSSWKSEQARTTAHIFSLRENKWRKIEFDRVVYTNGKQVLLNEKLYWVGYSNDVGAVIVSFDLGIEKFDIIKLRLHRFSYLGVMGARLSESEYDNTDIKDELIKQILGSTIIEKSIYHLPKDIIVDCYSYMIAYMTNGSFFVTGKFNDGKEFRPFWGRRMLWLVDTSMESMQYKTLLKSNEPINIARYVPTLVSPFPILSYN